MAQVVDDIRDNPKAQKQLRRYRVLGDITTDENQKAYSEFGGRSSQEESITP